MKLSKFLGTKTNSNCNGLGVAWILSRTPTIDHALQAQLIKTLTSGGVGKSKLIFPSTVNCPANY